MESVVVLVDARFGFGCSIGMLFAMSDSAEFLPRLPFPDAIDEVGSSTFVW